MVLSLLFFLFFQFSPYTKVDHFTVQNGLSQNTVNALLHDSYGYIWVGTEDKLNRYDGYRFEKFQNMPYDSTSLSHNYISSLHEDESGQIWVGTYNEINLYQRSKNGFKRFKMPEHTGIPLQILKITSYKQELFILTTNGVFTKLIDTTDPIQRHRVLHFQEHIFDMNVDRNGVAWLSSDRQNIYRYHFKSQTVKPIHLDPRFFYQSLTVDSEGMVWIGLQQNKLLRYDPSSNEHQIIRLPARSKQRFTHVYRIIEKKNELLVSTIFNGLYLIDKHSLHVQSISKNAGLSTLALRDILLDDTGMVWVGTQGNGLELFRPNTFLARHIKPPHPNARLWGIGSYQQKLTFISNQKIYTYQAKKNQALLLKNAEISFDAFTLAEKENTLYFGGLYGGVRQYEKKKGITIPAGLEVVQNHIVGKLKFIDHRLWAADQFLIFTYDTERHEATPIRIFKNERPFIYRANDYVLTKDSTLWIATNQNGLVSHNLKTKHTEFYSYHIQNKNSVSSNETFMLHLEEDETRLWIGTKSGLNLLDLNTRTFQHFHGKDGLPNETIYAILEDNFGNHWLSTNFGISKVRASENTFKFTNYNASHGLMNVEYNQNSYFKDSSGRLYFGGNNGIDYITPEPNDAEVNSANVHIRALKTNKTFIHFPKDTLRFSSRHTVLEFQFTQPNFKESQNKKYFYKLDGYDTEWKYNGENQIVRYTNLEPQSYTFFVSPNPKNVNKTAQLTVHILPPFWKTTGFNLCVMLCVLAGITLYLMRQKQLKDRLENLVLKRTDELQQTVLQLEETTQFKNAVMDTIVHDIKNPVHTILCLLEKKKTDSDYKGIYSSANEILNLTLSLLETHKYDDGELMLEKHSHFLKRIVEKSMGQIEAIAQKKQINVCEMVSETIRVHCDEPLIVRVCVNLLTNAIKHSAAGSEVQIYATETTTGIELVIKDFGEGIPETFQEKIFERFSHYKHEQSGFLRSTGIGLAFCKIAIEAHGQTLWVRSAEGEGSEFRFTLEPSNSETVQPTPMNQALNTYLTDLKQLDVCEASSIFSILDQIEGHEMKPYIHQIKQAVLESDHETYEKLIGQNRL